MTLISNRDSAERRTHRRPGHRWADRERQLQATPACRPHLRKHPAKTQYRSASSHPKRKGHRYSSNQLANQTIWGFLTRHFWRKTLRRLQDLAIDALEALQSQGRTEGVISHVEMMKDRIPRAGERHAVGWRQELRAHQGGELG